MASFGTITVSLDADAIREIDRLITAIESLNDSKPGPSPVEEVIPEPSDNGEVTLAELRALATAKAIAVKDRAPILAVLTALGVSKFDDLHADHYPEAKQRLEAIGNG